MFSQRSWLMLVPRRLRRSARRIDSGTMLRVRKERGVSCVKSSTRYVLSLSLSPSLSFPVSLFLSLACPLSPSPSFPVSLFLSLACPLSPSGGYGSGGYGSGGYGLNSHFTSLTLHISHTSHLSHFTSLTLHISLYSGSSEIQNPRRGCNTTARTRASR
jgi:hypothetical protein